MSISYFGSESDPDNRPFELSSLPFSEYSEKRRRIKAAGGSASTASKYCVVDSMGTGGGTYQPPPTAANQQQSSSRRSADDHRLSGENCGPFGNAANELLQLVNKSWRATFDGYCLFFSKKLFIIWGVEDLGLVSRLLRKMFQILFQITSRRPKKSPGKKRLKKSPSFQTVS
jgi:hypothetical protein